MAHGTQVASELSKASEPGPARLLRVVDAQGNELLKIPVGNYWVQRHNGRQ